MNVDAAIAIMRRPNRAGWDPCSQTDCIFGHDCPELEALSGNDGVFDVLDPAVRKKSIQALPFVTHCCTMEACVGYLCKSRAGQFRQKGTGVCPRLFA